MRHFVPAFAILLIAACAPREPLPQVAEELRKFDAELAAIDRSIADIQKTLSGEPPDFRGRVPPQDFEQWVLAKPAREEIGALRTSAAESSSLPAALKELGEARLLINTEFEHAVEIGKYWTDHRPAPHWRRYWNGLFEANHADAEAPDSMLLAIEKDLTASLAKGAFTTAGRDSDVLTSVLYESLDRASMRIIKVTGKTAVFEPRATACVPGAPSVSSQKKPKVFRADSIESFYPTDALKRGESGSVILRARVDAKGCGTAVAIVVRSGIDSLDKAALQWFETAQFSPASAARGPIESELMFKVKFVIQEKSAGVP